MTAYAHSPFDCYDIATASTAWSDTQMTDTQKVVQVYTKQSVKPLKAFSHSGMVTWLKAKFPTSTNYHVEAATGIPASTVHGWLIRKIKPSSEHLLMMFCAFGPSFVKAVMSVELDWLETADKQQQLNETEAQIARLKRERDRLIT